MDVLPSWTIPKPSDDQVLLWFQSILLWMISNYTSSNKPTEQKDIAKQNLPKLAPPKKIVSLKATITAICCALLPGLTAAHWLLRILLPVVFLLLTSALSYLRIFLAQRESKFARLAELEVIANLVFLLVSVAIIVLGNVHLYATIRVPLSDRRSAVILAMVSGTIFLVEGGTRIVRGILDASGASPKIKDDVVEEAKPQSLGETLRPVPFIPVDSKEYNRGRLIGDIERLLLLIVVIAGKDETLGLIIVAKGLIRSRQFKNRDLTEYVIIGTLISTLLAIAIGLILQYVSTTLW